MVPVASQLIEEVAAHAQSDSPEDAREICADGTYFPNNLRNYRYTHSLFIPCFGLCCPCAYQIFAKLHTPHERLCRPVSDYYFHAYSVKVSFQDF